MWKRLELEDSSEESSEGYVFPAESIETIRWADLMLMSCAASENRSCVERHTHRLEDLWLRAKLFEAQAFLSYASDELQSSAHGVRQRKRANDFCEMLLEKLDLKIQPSMAVLENDFNRWVAEINSFSPVTFMQYVCLFREDEGSEETVVFRLLESLSVELEWPRVKQRLRKISLPVGEAGEVHHWTSWTQSQLGAGFKVFYEEADWEFIEKISTKKFPARTGDFRYWIQNSWTGFWILLSQGSATNSFTATYSISPATQVLGCNPVELAMMLKEMTLLAPHSRAFTTVMGRAILQRASELVRWSYWWEILVDVGFIGVLLGITHDVSLQKVPSVITVLFLGLLATATCGSLIARTLTSIFFFSGSYYDKFLDYGVVVWKTMAFWTLLQIVLELFSVGVVAWYVWCIQQNDWTRAATKAAKQGIHDWSQIFWIFFTDKLEMFHRRQEVVGSGILGEHPSYLSFLILIRWMHFIVALFQLESVGRNIVPVIHAVRQPESLFFMIFLLLALMASCHSYAVYPIKENVGSWNELFNGMLKIFRLEFLGDFDLNEMEGLDDEIKGTLYKNNTITAEVDEAHYNTKYHQGIRTQFIFLSLGITLVAMNTYIGLLGELYSQAVKKKNQLYSHYLASTTYQHLCLRIFFLRRCGRCPCAPCEVPEVPHDSQGLYWMAYNKAMLVDKDD